MAGIGYINTEKDGLCVWSEATKEFIPLKQFVEHYEKAAKEMGIPLLDNVDENIN